jgi:apolipoprotein N-acyltransferase
MESGSNIRSARIAVLAVVSTALLIWFGNGLEPWWPLLWFAPLPVMMFAARHSWRSAGVIALVAWLLGSLNLWHYLHVLQVPAIVWFVIFGLEAVIFALAVLMFRALLLRGAVWSALLALPAAWVTFEFLRNLSSVHGTALTLAYSQLKFVPFLQVASLAGPWGMSFLLLLFPSAVAIWWHLRHTAPCQAVRVLCVGVGLVALALIFGAIRLALPIPGPRVRVGLVASDKPENIDRAAHTERLFRDYAQQAEKLIGQGAQAVVLPEKVGVVTNANIGDADAIFQSLADKTGAVIVVGVVRVSPPVKYNQALIYSPGSPLLTYDKHHMLPPFEDYLKPGTTLTLMPRHGETWGVAICKDMDFTPLSRQYGEAGAGLMLVPGWDFELDRSLHGHMAVMRGVEDGFSVGRAANQGYLTVSDNRGRILAETRSDSAPFATLLADVPARHENTVCLWLGDWFGWFSLAILISILALGWKGSARGH